MAAGSTWLSFPATSAPNSSSNRVSRRYVFFFNMIIMNIRMISKVRVASLMFWGFTWLSSRDERAKLIIQSRLSQVH